MLKYLIKVTTYTKIYNYDISYDYQNALDYQVVTSKGYPIKKGGGVAENIPRYVVAYWGVCVKTEL